MPHHFRLWMQLTFLLRSSAGFAAIFMINGVELGVEEKSRPDRSVAYLTKRLFGIYPSHMREVS